MESINAAEALANLIEDFASANISAGERPLAAVKRFSGSVNWTSQEFMHRFLELVTSIRNDVSQATHIPATTAELAKDAVSDASQLVNLLFEAQNFQALTTHIRNRNIIRELRFVGAFIDRTGNNDCFDASKAQEFVEVINGLIADVLNTLPNNALKQSILVQLRTLRQIFEEIRYHGMAEAEASARMLLGTLLLRISEFKELDEESKGVVQKVANFLKSEYRRVEPFVSIGSAALQVYGFLPEAK